MKSWIKKRIKDIFDTYTGATPSSKVSSYWDGDIVWITPADMSDFGDISNGETNITEAGYKSCSTNLVPKGSIVLSSRAPIGKVNIAARPLCTNQGCKSLVPKNVNAKFVAYYLYNSSEELDVLGLGTTFKELPLKRIVSFPIVLPPKIEQERIVTYLDEKTASIDNRINQLVKLSEMYCLLKASIIQSTITKGLNEDVELIDSGIEYIGKIPKGWTVRRIKDVFDTYTGATPSSKVSSYWDGDIVWITPADMSDFGDISNGETNITEAGYKSCSTNLVPKGSIVLSSRAPIGKVNIAARPLCTNQGCKSLVPKGVNAKFAAYYLFNSSKELDILGQGTTFKELPLKRIVSFPIVLPPKIEQERIVAYLDEKCSDIESNIDKINLQIEAYKKLKKALIKEVITGERAV